MTTYMSGKELCEYNTPREVAMWKKKTDSKSVDTFFIRRNIVKIYLNL